ncbi:MAG: hypothetical protein NTZ74_11050 [Chloroflexi bacterium]|nr:hypothetical protein [Chloroflexota bacterium]
MAKKIVVLLLVFVFLLSACAGKTHTPSPTEVTGNTTSSSSNNSGGNSSSDISQALNLVLGSSDTPGVFPSYHIELVLDTPQANTDDSAVVMETVKISADVAGSNVHLFQIDPGETVVKEGFIISDTGKEYKMVDGVPQETLGQIGLSWAMWPLKVVLPYAFAAALYTDRTGTAEVNGRTAVVYTLDTTKADPATVAGMQAVGMGNMVVAGTVWIDQNTEAMIKLILDYSTDVKSLDGSTNLGTGKGHIELEISKVGEVSVTAP